MKRYIITESQFKKLIENIITELNPEIYLSAAKKLSNKHPLRAIKLAQHGSKNYDIFLIDKKKCIFINFEIIGRQIDSIFQNIESNGLIIDGPIIYFDEHKKFYSGGKRLSDRKSAIKFIKLLLSNPKVIEFCRKWAGNHNLLKQMIKLNDIYETL